MNFFEMYSGDRPSPLEFCLLQELAAAAKGCTDRGWCAGTAGNFSLRLYGQRTWFSPSGAPKGLLRPEDFVCLHGPSFSPDAFASRRPSGEYPIHLGIYRRVEWARAIVHAHSPGIVRASKGRQCISIGDDEMLKHLGAEEFNETVSLPVMPNPERKRIAAQTEEAGEYIANDKIPLLILEGHGAYAWGKDPFEAFCFLESAEFLCANL